MQSRLVVLLLLFAPACAQGQGWQLTSPLSAPRDTHSAVVLLDGNLLLTGGGDGVAVFSGAELFDQATRTWSAASPMQIARLQHSADVLADGRVLVVGGQSGTAVLSSTEIFDPVNASWTSTGSLSQAKFNIALTRLLDNRVLATGGQTNVQGTLTTRCEVFNPLTDVWLLTAPLTIGRQDHTATLLVDGRVLVAGGTTGNQSGYSRISSAELYDPVTGSWTPIAPMSRARAAHTAMRLSDGRVLVVGGLDSAGVAAVAESEIFDPTSGMWAQGPTLAQARYGHEIVAAENGIVVAGGVTTSGVLNSVESLAAPFEQWRQLPPMNYYRVNFTLNALPGGKVVAAGGFGAIGGGELSRLNSSEIVELGDHAFSDGFE